MECLAWLLIPLIKYMKIYALVYKYDLEKDKDDTANSFSNKTGMIQLIHTVNESLEDAMEDAEKEIKNHNGYIPYSLKLDLKSIIPLDSVLDNIKVKLPELIKSAKAREKLTKVAEALNEYENKS